MTDTAHETPALEMQLLTAQDGTAYLLPRALLEAARLTPEQAAAFRETAEGDDVHGHLMIAQIGQLAAVLSSYSQPPADQNPAAPKATTTTTTTAAPKAY